MFTYGQNKNKIQNFGPPCKILNFLFFILAVQSEIVFKIIRHPPPLRQN